MDQTRIDDLKAKEASLILDLESKNLKKNNLLKKHRQILLNGAHFLMLFHQSSKNIVEHFAENGQQTFNTLTEETSYAVNIQDILQHNGLRLIWDAYYNSEFLRSALILEYLNSQNILPEQSSYYFKYELIETIYKKIFQQEEDANFTDNISVAFLSTENSDLFINHIQSNINVLPLNIVLPTLARFYTILKKIESPQQIPSIPLFVEKGTDFCEFPHLHELKSKDRELIFDFEQLKTKIKPMVSKLISEKLESISNEPQNFVIDSLMELGFDEDFIKSLSLKLNDLKSRGNSEKLKIELADIFDKLMKSIQTSIRSNQVYIDDALLLKADLIESILNESVANQNVQSFLNQLQQNLKNKSNIIFTIHQNELSALNSKLDINSPIGSRLYYAIAVIRKLFNAIEIPLISDLLKDFTDTWISHLHKTFKELTESNNELFSLSWLSVHFNNLNVSFEDAETVLIKFGFHVQEIKSKYTLQSAMLSGLFETSRMSSPSLKSTENIDLKSTQLLPHFISL